MKLDPSSLMQVGYTAAEECARYETADRAFILIFTLDARRHNHLTLLPRPKNDYEFFGPWLDECLPYNDRGEALKRYSQDVIYESDDCFYAVYVVPGNEDEDTRISVILVEPEDAYTNEIELYRMKGLYVANAFGANRCLNFPTLKAAIGTAY
ncbi:hypothetical protein GGI20_006184 [Coemansia sp. BCRC 34301]|nr:hypothetical protein GGI20_006184 [Coemansia sp. BCRC 34301]